MSNSIVENQTKQVESFLQETVTAMTHYLNHHTIGSLLGEAEEGNQPYYEGLLATMRRLLVFCEEGLDACRVLLQSKPFRKGAAERMLYKIYHQVICEFFSPKHDQWYENSRSAYTGRNAIAFHMAPPPSLKELIRSLEGKFQAMREELEYYETDYQTKMIQSQ
ncbi:YpuI family protein [Ectobacillus ponti]|uniref:YpuI family protein n=1 Tax=Ectobacillus ponti TaxID=2961894 RepID=A0AA41X9D8_9BACI|nr:YpuI family protein [Ectobacillus ponti]MCP8968708.1 YpuI family protein [Ectobacillus ponti]